MSKKKAADSGASRSKAAKKKTDGKRRKARKLKPRQLKALQAIVGGEVPRQALLEAGYSERVADHPQEFLDTQSMRAAMSKLLASPEKIAQRINEGLDAVETKFFQFGGVVTDHRDVIAWGERRMYADLAAELKGLKPGQKVEIDGNVAARVQVEYVNVATLEES